MKIGQVIKALRSEKGLSQEALALEVDTATSNLSRIEKGQRTPSLDLVYRLAKALGVSVSEVFRAVEEGEMPKSRTGKGNFKVGEERAAYLPDYAEDAVEMRLLFRELSPANRASALVMIRALKAAEKV